MIPILFAYKMQMHYGILENLNAFSYANSNLYFMQSSTNP